MKILIISPKSKGIGGIASHVSELATLLKERGFYVKIVSAENTPIVNIKGLKNSSFAFFSVFHPYLMKEYDIAHAHNLPSIIPLRFARAQAKILTLHGIYSKQISFLYGRIFGRIAEIVEKKMLTWIDGITAISKSVKKYYEALGLKVEYIPNAVNIHKLPKEVTKLYDNQIVYVGRLSKEKGVDILVKAFIKTKLDAHLLIVGKGPLEGFLRKYAQKDKRIHYTGYLEHSKALSIIAGSDLLILPSLYEGLSTVILEAMALKTPVLASDISENKELIQHGETGFLFPKGSVEKLAFMIEYLLSKKDLLRKVSEKAYQLVLAEYTWDVVIEKYVDFYEKIIEAENL
ncbi:MAG: glycosyltransferase family 1 protein [Thermoprotei archaeon]|nr:MAG: glycosyltransferase family 1 protein [Thermoprotei archaeon]